MTTHTETPTSEPTIVMTRVYPARRALVWTAMTEPAHVRRWWGGAGVTSPICEMDVRPGGRWRHVMVFPDGKELRLDFTFDEVDAPRRLVWHATEPPAEGPAPHFTSTLEELDDETRCTLVIRFATLAERELALGYGFTGPIAASNDLLEVYLRELRP